MSFFSEKLRELRLSRGINQDGIPGMSQGAVSQLENATRPPTPKVIKTLTAFFDISETELLGSDSNQSHARDMLMRSVRDMSDADLDKVNEILKAIKAIKAIK